MPLVKLSDHKTMTTSEVEISQHEYDTHQSSNATFWGWFRMLGFWANTRDLNCYDQMAHYKMEMERLWRLQDKLGYDGAYECVRLERREV